MRGAVPAVQTHAVACGEHAIFDLRDELALARRNTLNGPGAFGELRWEVDEVVFECHDEQNQTDAEQNHYAHNAQAPAAAAIKPLQELLDCAHVLASISFAPFY